MNLMTYQPLLNQFEKSTERSFSIKQPVERGGYELTFEEVRSPNLGTSFDTNSSGSSPFDSRPIWQVIKEIRDQVPSQDWNQVPADGSKRLEYYLKGKLGKHE